MDLCAKNLGVGYNTKKHQHSGKMTEAIYSEVYSFIDIQKNACIIQVWAEP